MAELKYSHDDFLETNWTEFFFDVSCLLSVSSSDVHECNNDTATKLIAVRKCFFSHKNEMCLILLNNIFVFSLCFF